MSVKYLFVCSMSRSGSTLLDLLLGGHSQIESLGELTFLPKVIALDQKCSCGEKITVCKEWKKVFEGIRGDRGIDVLDGNPYKFWLGDFIDGNPLTADRKRQNLLYKIAYRMRGGIGYSKLKLPEGLSDLIPLPLMSRKGLDNTFYLYDLIREICKKEVVVDSSKRYLKAIELYRKCPGSFRIILLVRDGRGVANSRKERLPFSSAVLEWRKYYSRALPLLKRYVSDEDICIIKYEDLVVSPNHYLKKLCSFAGLEYEYNMMDMASGERHSIGGNVTRFKRSKGIRLDERWRQELTAAELHCFEKKCGDLKRKLGYR